MRTSKKHILCVDDNSDTGQLISAILKEYETTSAYSMADAVKRATATSSITEAQAITAGAQGLVQKGAASFTDDLPTRVSQLLKA